jgi:hypothetical protein
MTLDGDPSRLRRLPLPVAAVFAIAAAYACGSSDDGGAAPPGPDPGDAGSDVAPAPAADAGAEGGAGSSALFYKSGTRLRARVVKGDGEPLFETLVDTVKNVACSFKGTKDAGLRCLPSNVADIAYLDDQCTTGVALDQAPGAGCGTGAAYAQRTEIVQGCNEAQFGTGSELFTVGAEIAPAPATYWMKSAAGCEEVPLAANLRLRALGPEVVVTDFVGGKAVDENPDPALRRRRIVGDDGSELALTQLYDVARNIACQPYRLSPPGAEALPAKRYCGPAWLAYADPDVGPFSDPACSDLAAGRPTIAACPAPYAIRRIDVPPGGAQCADQISGTLFELGAPLASTYRDPGCATTTIPGYASWALGPAIAPSAYPELDRESVGGGRIRPFGLTAAGVLVDPDFHMWDDSTGALCTPMAFDGGALYCVPSSVSDPAARFEDAACTKPVAIAYGCQAPRVALTGTVACGDELFSRTVRPLAPTPLSITEYYTEDGAGGCDPTPVPLSDGVVAFSVLPAVDVATLYAEVTRSVE